jgi:hypothetical protein
MQAGIAEYINKISKKQVETTKILFYIDFGVSWLKQAGNG